MSRIPNIASWSLIYQEKPGVIDNIKRSLVNFYLRLKDIVSNFYAPSKKAGSGLASEEYGIRHTEDS
jgi:translation elongation factor EF-4